MLTSNLNFTTILERLQNGYSAEKNEIKHLLNLSDPEDIHLLFKSARNVRTKHFDNNIFLWIRLG